MKRKANQKIERPMNPDARLVLAATKISPNEAMDLEPKVLHFAKGKMSVYLRAALLNYKPKKEDFKC